MNRALTCNRIYNESFDIEKLDNEILIARHFLKHILISLCKSFLL